MTKINIEFGIWQRQTKRECILETKNKDENNGKDEIETQRHKNKLKKKYLTCPNTSRDVSLIQWEFHQPFR